MTSKLLLFAAFVISMLLMSINHRKKRKKVVFLGDSITEQGTRSGGFIISILKLLREESLEDDYELVSAGVSGDKVYDLYLRLEDDILAKGADIVVIFIGVNDVGHKYSILTGTDVTRFEAFYTAIIDKLLSAEIKVVVCTPCVIGEKIDFSSEVDFDLNLYSDVIRNLSRKYSLSIVDLRKAFVEYNKASNYENDEYGILTIDKVHLSDKGNKLVAEEMWHVLQQIK